MRMLTPFVRSDAVGSILAELFFRLVQQLTLAGICLISEYRRKYASK